MPEILNDIRMFPAQRFRLTGFRAVTGDDIPHPTAFRRELEHGFSAYSPALALRDAAHMSYTKLTFTNWGVSINPCEMTAFALFTMLMVLPTPAFSWTFFTV